jgi:cystathionine gamma-synthase
VVLRVHAEEVLVHSWHRAVRRGPTAERRARVDRDNRPVTGTPPPRPAAPDAARRPASLVVAAGRPAPDPDAPLSVPIVAASTYRAGGPVGYGRFGNPTWEALEDVLGRLEGGRAVAFASGMAAVAAVLDLLAPGAVVVVPRHAYNGTLALLDALHAGGRVEPRRVDVADTAAVLAALPAPGTPGALWIESPTNPALEIADIAALAVAARERGLLTVVDNTFATPLVQRPLALGADLVVHSVTKSLAGHSDALLGAVVAADEHRVGEIVAQRSLRGAVPSPHDAWLALRGMRTLDVRLSRSQASAQVLAERLAALLGPAAVRYPGLVTDPGHRLARRQMTGFGSVVCADLGSPDRAQHLCEGVRLWVHATSLGGVESMLERRRRWALESPSIPEGLVRLSVGIEDVEDLWDDLAGTLAQVDAGD